MAPEGVAVGAAMIPVLVGGVIGAGVGTMLLYGGEEAQERHRCSTGLRYATR